MLRAGSWRSMRPGPRLVLAVAVAAAAVAAAATAVEAAAATAVVVAVAVAVAAVGKPQAPPSAAPQQQSHAGRVREVLPVFL